MTFATVMCTKVILICIVFHYCTEKWLKRSMSNIERERRERGLKTGLLAAM